MNANDVLSPWLALIPALFFPFMWILASAIIAKASGWRLLARRFAASPDARERGAARQRFMFSSGSMGRLPFAINMRHILHVEIGDAGLRLALMFLFKAFAKDLLIPWSEVERVEEVILLRFFKMTRIYLRGSPIVINVSGKAGQALLARSQTPRARATSARL